MIEFDLERALAGDKVITRCGDEVEQLMVFNCRSEKSLYCVIDCKVQSFDSRGRFNYIDGNTSFDLFMAPKKLSGFINVYKYNGAISATLKSAKDAACIGILARIDLSQFNEGHGLENEDV